MLQINTLPPERMTAEQRCAELAGLLAAGLCRLRQPDFAKSANTPQETPLYLAFRSNRAFIQTSTTTHRWSPE